MLERLFERPEWKFFAALPRADRALAFAWWAAVVLRGLLPAVFAVAMGMLVAAVQRGGSLGAPLGLAGVVFVLLQVLPPLHQALSREPRQPRRGLALRPADRRLRRGRRAWDISRTRSSPATSRWPATSTSA